MPTQQPTFIFHFLKNYVMVFLLPILPWLLKWQIKLGWIFCFFFFWIRCSKLWHFLGFYSREVFIICMTYGTGKKEKKFNLFTRFTIEWRRVCPHFGELIQPMGSSRRSAGNCSLAEPVICTPPHLLLVPALVQDLGSEPCDAAECMCVHVFLLFLRIWHKPELPACAPVL